MGHNERLSRRAFLKGLAGSVLFTPLAACSGEVPFNEREKNKTFGERLRTFLDISETSTRGDLARIAADRIFGPTDPNWLLGQELGTFENDTGKPVSLGLDYAGEATIIVDTIVDPISYVPPHKLNVASLTSPNGAEIHIYGNSETSARMENNKGVIEATADIIFQGNVADRKQLLINMCPYGYPLPYDETEGISQEGKELLIQGFGHTYFYTPEGTEKTVQIVNLNANAIHNWARQVGVPASYNVIETVGNEGLGSIGQHEAMRQGYNINTRAREAVTTIGGWATLFDPSVTGKLVLGPDSGAAFGSVVGEEMETLLKIAQRAS